MIDFPRPRCVLCCLCHGVSFLCFSRLIATCKEEIALLKPCIAKGALQTLKKEPARAPQEFRFSFFASKNKQVQKKHRNSEEPPFAIRGAGDTLPDVEESFSGCG